jgi:hypothetical protein
VLPRSYRDEVCLGRRIEIFQFEGKLGERMDTEKHIKTLEALAKGIDPATGEVLPDESPYNNPEVIRSLFSVIDLLKSPYKITSLKKTVEQKQAENLEKGLPKNAGVNWSYNERELLKKNFWSQQSIEDIGIQHERTSGAIRSELQKLGLIEE